MPSTQGTDMDKATLRSHHMELRDSLDLSSREELDQKIFSHLSKVEVFSNAGLVLTYVSYRSEVDTHAIINALLKEGRRVAVPRCDKKKHTMSFFELSSFDDLEPGAHNILEPKKSLVKAVTVPDMIGSACLVPGLIFDTRGRRIGYGGGYYDRFLAKTGAVCAALCAEARLTNALPAEPFDRRCDYIFTEGRILHTDEK